MKRILFVDDEPAVLQGLEHQLRRQRSRWDMDFALGGARAIETLRGGRFDVVVTDLRMPGIDGDALLQVVKNEHPGTIRIVLSGVAERVAVVRALAVAQQLLAKPCTSDELVSAIDLSLRARELLPDERLVRLVGRVDRLPSPPQSYWALARAVDDPDTTTADVVRIIESDPAMAAKLLQIANSAYFGAGRRIAAIEQAVVLLGLELVRTLMLAAHVFQLGDGLPPQIADAVRRVREHSFIVARVARKLATAEQREEAFTAGLLHDVGRLVLAVCPDASLGRQRGEPDRSAIEAAHDAIGAYLLALWRLPPGIVHDVRFHEEPSRATDPARRVPLAVLHAADRLVNAAADPANHRRLDMDFLHSAGVASRIDVWRSVVQAEL